MSETTTPSNEQVHKVPLKVLVDKEKNKVLFVETGKDFVDVLLSFLTLPLGTITRLVAEESNMQPVKVGSVSSLYEKMLLHPRNSLESYCQHLKLNIDNTEPTKYFLCANYNCNRKQSGSLFSIFRNQRCSCGKQINRIVSPENSTLENGFVKETATFITCDDLSELPNVLGTIVDLLRKLGVKDMDAIEEQTVDISKREVVDLLKLSLLSKTPLTDFIIEKKQYVENFNPINQFRSEIGEESSDEGRQMVLKVLVRKSNKKILFAEAEEDFADFLFSFLTFPLGGVLHMLKGSSSLSCIDKLYKSMIESSSDRYLKSQGLKDKFSNPPCAPQFNLSNQILPIGEACLPMYYCCTYYAGGKYCLALVISPKPSCSTYDKNVRLDIVDPKSCIGNSSSYGGFVKGPSMYMVTDDLVVTPMSSISGVTHLNKLQVSLFDLEEKVISIGLKEGLCILKASLTSTSTLTDALKHFLK
ncbi:hypothetical protein VNO77_20495 [Canavalia gladiata]|uniref:DUF674 family protein n=1 Tax=Canavalia gladiata TaxID=3824 RepID=A0AAN9LPC1_CANGL